METGSGLRTMAATATVLVALSVGGCNRDAEGTETASPTGSATASTSTSPTPTFIETSSEGSFESSPSTPTRPRSS